MAAEGWRLVAIPPIAEMKNVLGLMQMGRPLYAMEREWTSTGPGGCASTA